LSCRHGWSAEKYRKVAQRGRARLPRLLEHDEPAAVPRVLPASDEVVGNDL